MWWKESPDGSSPCGSSKDGGDEDSCCDDGDDKNSINTASPVTDNMVYGCARAARPPDSCGINLEAIKTKPIIIIYLCIHALTYL